MYKFILFLFFGWGYVQISQAQIVFQMLPDSNTLTDADKQLMQEGYMLAYSNMTSETYLFKGREEEWKKCWTNLLHQFNRTLKQNGLNILSGSNYNRIYFRADGTVVAYLYCLSGLDHDQEILFKRLAFSYFSNTKIAIAAPGNYWQYGTLKFE